MIEINIMLLILLISLIAWTFLFAGRGGFWCANQTLSPALLSDGELPSVIAIIPARDESLTIGMAVSSLANQSYTGKLLVIVVNDNSTDKTVDAALSAAASVGHSKKLIVVNGAPLKSGWTGKMWAVNQGIKQAVKINPNVDYIFLTDADIVHDSGNLSRLVSKAKKDNLHLVSLMVRLRCKSFWEKLLVPAFVFYFQKLYPFSRVNSFSREEAAAAGGCMLVRRETLISVGGVQSIKGEVIDDCALAKLIKRKAPIWLGLATDNTKSIRPYNNLVDFWKMVTRSAFVQLDNSIFQLVTAISSMFLLYWVPPIGLIFGHFWTWHVSILAALICILMFGLYLPTLKLYKASSLWGPSIVFAGIIFTLMTLDSARNHWLGRRSLWKGRTY